MYDRLGADEFFTEVMGVELPTLTIPVKPGRNLAVILEVAAQGPCVIVGRCADNVLEGKYPTMNVFIYSDMSYKVERSVQEHGLDPDKAASILTRRDKARAHHYRFYTERKWGDMRNYDICLDSGRLGLERCVDLLADAYRRW